MISAVGISTVDIIHLMDGFKAEEGSYHCERGEMLRYPAFSISCVDSTGAGDAFHGAFCHFLSRGAEIGRCLELSSAVGALNCRAYGGRAALPTSEELAAFLEENGCDPAFPGLKTF